jgi:excisionase family DNA binding protein
VSDEETYVEDLAEEIADRLADRLDVRPLLTFPQAAERLNISLSSVYTLVKRGDLAEVRPTEGSPRIEHREINRYLSTLRGVVDSGGGEGR